LKRGIQIISSKSKAFDIVRLKGEFHN